MAEEMDLISTIIMVFISPLGLYLQKGKTDNEFLVNLILYIVGFTIIGAIHGFYSLGMDALKAILNYLLPPVPVYMVTKDITKTLICCLLTCCFWVPGVVYAFWISMNQKKGEPLVN